MADDEFALIAGVRVDIASIRKLAHTCNPSLCRGTKTCCSSYEVVTDQSGANRIFGMMASASKYATHLRDGDSYIYPFEDEGRWGAVLATDDTGRCVFAYDGKDGGTRCSLHAAALELGLPPHRYKPFACALWPLALSEGKPPTLTVQPGVLGFPCNRGRYGATRSLHAGVIDTLEACFGASFTDQLNQALDEATV